MDQQRHQHRTHVDSSQFQQDVLPARASVALSHWYVQNKTDEEEAAVLLHRVGASFSLLGNDVVDVYKKFQALDEYERATLDDLRDLGVSVGDVIDYLRAEPGLNPAGRPIRTDVATDMRKREFKSQSDRIESSGRSAAILAGSLALVAVATVAVAPTVLPAVAPTIAPMVTAKIAPALALVAPLKSAATSLIQFAAGGGAIAVMWQSWGSWQKIRSGSPRLDIGKDEEFKDLPNSLGRQDYKSLNDHYEAIPSADRYLLAHLSNTEMRMFLAGNDSVRKHLLSANPPAPLAKIHAKLDTLARSKNQGVGAKIKKIASVCAVLITAPWHRNAGNGRIPKLDQLLESWRANADMNRDLREEPWKAELSLPGSTSTSQVSGNVVDFMSGTSLHGRLNGGFAPYDVVRSCFNGHPIENDIWNSINVSTIHYPHERMKEKNDRKPSGP